MISTAYDRIAAMRHKESTSYVCSGYLLEHQKSAKYGANPSGNSDVNYCGVDQQCREQICQWFFSVVDHFHIDREIVEISMSHLDRFMSSIDCNERGIFKLAAISSLHLAIKTYDQKKFDYVAKLLPRLSRGEFSMPQISKMELVLLRQLSWLTNPPTSACFVRDFLALISPMEKELLEKTASRALFFTELANFDYFFVSQKPSSVAFSALVLAVELGAEDTSTKSQTLEVLVDAVKRVAPDLLNDSEDMRRIRSILWIRCGRIDDSEFNHPAVSSSPTCVSMTARAG